MPQSVQVKVGPGKVQGFACCRSAAGLVQQNRYDEGNLVLTGSSPVKRFSIFVLCAGLMLLVACESKDTKKSARPVTQAMAPSIQPSAASPDSLPAAAKQQSPAPVQTPQPEKPDPVPSIIAEAEKAYDAG